MPTLKKVLIVEDDESYHEEWVQALKEKVESIHAYSVEEGERLFESNPDIALVIMDACVPGDSPTTESLVKKIRQSFSGPIIAASSVSDYRKILMQAGCDHESRKHEVPFKVAELLSL